MLLFLDLTNTKVVQLSRVVLYTTRFPFKNFVIFKMKLHVQATSVTSISFMQKLRLSNTTYLNQKVRINEVSLYTPRVSNSNEAEGHFVNKQWLEGHTHTLLKVKLITYKHKLVYTAQ